MDGISPESQATQATPSLRATEPTQASTSLVSRYYTFLYGSLFFLAGCATWWLYGGATMPLELDNQHYFFMAERAASGVPPHVSNFDPKHTLSTLLSGAGIAFGRIVGIDDVAASRIVSLIFTGWSAACVWLLAARLSSRLLAGHLAALAMLGYAGFIEQGVMGVCSKVFMVPFAVLALLALTGGHLLWVGIWTALAYLNWQPTLLIAMTAGLIYLFRPQRIKNIAAIGIGLLLPNLFYETYFVATNAVEEQLFQSYRFPSKYMSGEFDGWSQSLSWVAANWDDAVGWYNPTGAIFVLAAAACVMVAIVRPVSAARFLRQRSDWLAFMVCAAAFAAFTFYDHQGYVDLFVVMPFIAVGSGCAVDWLLPRNLPKVPSAPRVVAGGAAMVLFVILAVLAPRRFEYNYSLQDQRDLGREVAPWLERGHAVYAVGCTHLLAFNRVDNFTNYGFFLRGLLEYVHAELTEGKPYRPVRDGKYPDIVLKSRKKVPDIDDWLESSYEEITSAPFRNQRVAVWRRSHR